MNYWQKLLKKQKGLSLGKQGLVDDELLAKIAQETEGFISWETRVQRFDSEIDIEEERKRLEEERQKSIEETQKAFGSYEFKEENEDDSDSLDSNGD